MTRPYIGPSESQSAAMAAVPRTTDALARWFADRFADDVPSRLHAAGPWNGPQQYDRTTGTPRWSEALTGGSALGAPRLADAFRRFIEDGAHAVEYAVFDGVNQSTPHYARPMRANLAAFSVHHPLLARRLFHLGCWGDGDWRGAMWRYGPTLALEEAELLYREALRMLWERWCDEPPARVLRTA